jgi:hypothetical protein
VDEQDQAPPEVTLEPADNGWVVRHHQRSGKKDEPGRTIRRVASTDEEALGHARIAMGGGKASKKKSTRSVGRVADDEAGESSSAPAAHSLSGHHSRSSAKRRRPRAGGRRA